MRSLNSIAKKEFVYYHLTLTTLFVVIFYFILQSISHPPHDFSNYYFAGKYFIEGRFDPSIYDPTTFNLRLLEEGHEDFFVNFSPNSPFIPIFFAPLSYFEIGTAKLLFNMVNGFLFLFSLQRMIKHLAIVKSPLLILLPLICFVPVRNGLLFGQFYMLLFSMLIEGYLFYKKGKIVPAMLLWAIPTALKIAPGILVLYLIRKKDFKSLTVYSFIGFLILISTGLLINFDIYTFYLANISPKVSFGEIVSAGFLPNQSPLMFFKYLFVPDKLENHSLLMNSKLLFSAAMGITYTFILLLAWINSSNASGQKDFRTFGIWVLLIFLISPYGSSYSRILLIIVYLAAIQSGNLKKQLTIGLLLAGICNFPFSRLQDWPLIFQFIGLATTITVFALCLDQFLKKQHWIPTLLLLTFFTFYFNQIVNKRKDVGEYFLEQNPSLITDYEIAEQLLTYTYWNGSNQTGKIDFSYERNETSTVSIKNNQLYFGDQQLTSSGDNKRKPTLIDNNKIIYLSDWGRGYGFYALRVIQLQDE